MSDAMAKFDKFERAIMAALQRDARHSVQKLAELIGLSASPTWRRLKSLEERGVIKEYVARLDPVKLGYSQTVFAHVTLAKHSVEAIDAFERSVAAQPEVLELYSMTGTTDYIMRIAIRSTEEYSMFLRRVVYGSSYVQHIQSNFAVREIKNVTALPIPQ